MTTLTINIPNELKSSIQEKAKKDWVTLTFLTQQFYNAYLDWKAKFEMLFENNDEKEYIKLSKELTKAVSKLNSSKFWTIEEQLKDL